MSDIAVYYSLNLCLFPISTLGASLKCLSFILALYYSIYYIYLFIYFSYDFTFISQLFNSIIVSSFRLTALGIC